jgi:hypothetical protein
VGIVFVSHPHSQSSPRPVLQILINVSSCAPNFFLWNTIHKETVQRDSWARAYTSFERPPHLPPWDIVHTGSKSEKPQGENDFSFGRYRYNCYMTHDCTRCVYFYSVPPLLDRNARSDPQIEKIRTYLKRFFSLHALRKLVHDAWLHNGSLFILCASFTRYNCP